MREIYDHAREKARLGCSEQKSYDVKLTGRVYEPHKHRNDSPGDHDAGNPQPCTPSLDDKRSWDFQQNVSDEKNSRAQSEHPVAEPQTVRHFQRRIGNVHPVQESNHVKYPEEGK